MESSEHVTSDYLNCNPFEFESFSLDKHLYMMEFDVERWYSWIEEFTFRTKFINLEINEAQAIIQAYRFYMDDKNIGLPPPKSEHMDSLMRKIQDVLVDFPNGAFIRLSSRSPKDAPMSKAFTNMPDLIKDESLKLKHTNDFVSLSPNEKLRVIFNAIGRALVSKSADDAMKLLTNSERAFSDLLHSLDKDEKHWNMKLIVREWIDLDPGLEFRSFVVNNKLTCIAQYNDLLFYPELQSQEEKLGKQIQNYFKLVEPLIKYKHYIIDFVILPGNNVKVVEINPFGPVTGAPLFDYSTERYLLQGGDNVWNDLKETSLPSSCTEKEKEMIEKGLPVVRLLKETSPGVTDEYVSVMFQDILKKTKKEEVEVKKTQTKKSDNCVVS